MSEKGGKGFSMPPKAKAGDMNKGGKGVHVASGGKTTAVKEALPDLTVEQELPQDAKCLLDCEAANILQDIQEKMVLLSANPDIKIPVSFDMGLNYSMTGSCYTDPASVRRVLDTLKKHGVSDGEICVIAKLCPETVDEAFAFVPSLKAKGSEVSGVLKGALDQLSELKKSA